MNNNSYLCSHNVETGVIYVKESNSRFDISIIQ